MSLVKIFLIETDYELFEVIIESHLWIFSALLLDKHNELLTCLEVLYALWHKANSNSFHSFSSFLSQP